MAILTSKQLGLFEPEALCGHMTQMCRANRTAWVLAVLELLALQEAFFTAEIRACQARIRQKAKRTEEEDCRAILAALAEGYTRASEIAEFTRIPYDTLHRDLQKLLQTGQIRRERCAELEPVEPGRGGDRKTYLYFLNNKKGKAKQ